MTIGRISGPMLFQNLERQGLDLSIEGNLVYFDVNNLRVGINTDTPEYDLDVHGAVQVGNLIVKNIDTGESYSLPTDAGDQGSFLISDGTGQTQWGAAPVTIQRREFQNEIVDLPSGGYTTFEMDLGIASIVYNLTVSRPCFVEVFGNKYYNDTNPYAFLATIDHLTDDGSVLLDDGSVIQQRQYSIFANLDTPVEPKVYVRITNIDGVPGPVTLSLIYFPAVTDNSPTVYDVNVVTDLPSQGYTGQSVYKKNVGMFVFYDGTWHQV